MRLVSAIKLLSKKDEAVGITQIGFCFICVTLLSTGLISTNMVLLLFTEDESEYSQILFGCLLGLGAIIFFGMGFPNILGSLSFF